jgi:uncharacterized protein (DUF2267 family)
VRRLRPLGGGIGGTAVVGTALVPVGRQARVSRKLRRARTRARRRIRYRSGRMQGFWYRATGSAPSAEVSDRTLADRIRSGIGPLEKRLDIPRVHLSVHDGAVLLIGTVNTVEDISAICEAVTAVPGVTALVSNLRVGLSPADTRPSQGRLVAAPSSALKRLLAATERAGVLNVRQEQRLQVLHAVLSVFLLRLPEAERAHVRAHLPADVRALTEPPFPAPEAAFQMRTRGDLITAVDAVLGLGTAGLGIVVEAVLHALRELIPDEDADVAAVLPSGLRTLWTGTPPPT